MTSSNLDLVQVYTKGVKAWFPDDTLGWTSATVVSKEEQAEFIKIIFQDDNDSEKVRPFNLFCKLINTAYNQQHVFESKKSELPQATLPPLRNPPKMENTDDLTNLSYLNEPSGTQKLVAKIIEADSITN